MVAQQTLKDRLSLGTRFAWWATRPGAVKAQAELIGSRASGVDSFETVVAAPYESARLTLHRIEACGHGVVLLISQVGDSLVGQPFTNGPEADSRARDLGAPHEKIGPGLTVEQWMVEMRETPGEVAYSIDDSEFAPMLEAIESQILLEA